jgi:hypothetical protein
MRKLIGVAMAAALVGGAAGPGVAQQEAGPQAEKQLVQGPSTNSYGRLALVLPAGSEAEVQYLPETNVLSTRAIRGEARVFTSARHLLLVESVAGPVEIRLANGRVIPVEVGQSEIVGAALVDDPGQTIVRLNGTGPFLAQAGGPPPGGVPEMRTTVLTGNPAAALAGAGITPGPTVNTPSSISAFQP